MAVTIDKTLRLGCRVTLENNFRGVSPTSRLFTGVLPVVRTRTGTGVPNWKGKIRAKLNASSDLTGRYDTFTENGPQYNSIIALQDENGYWGNSNGGLTITEKKQSSDGNIAMWYIAKGTAVQHSWLFNWGSNADGRASNAFLAAIRNAYTEFSAGTFFGELHQTLRMIHRPAEALFTSAEGYLKKLSKRKLLDPKHWRDSIPSLYLEYSFGWRPLMMDISSAFNAANSMLDQQHVRRIKGSGKSEKAVLDGYYGGSVQPGYCAYLLHNIRRREIEREFVRYYGAINVKAGASDERYARWGFTPDDFVPTAWELLPWSFLIDYFTSIGDFIGGVFTRTGNVAWCSKVRRRESEMFLGSELLAPNLPAAAKAHTAATSPSTCTWKRLDVSRFASAGVPTPSLYIKKDGLSLGQFGNVSALFGQACVNLLPQTKTGHTFRLPR